MITRRKTKDARTEHKVQVGLTARDYRAVQRLAREEGSTASAICRRLIKKGIRK